MGKGRRKKCYLRTTSFILILYVERFLCMTKLLLVLLFINVVESLVEKSFISAGTSSGELFDAYWIWPMFR